MKKIFSILLTAVLGASLLASCSKSSNNATTGNGYMKAKVDGTLKECDLAVEATYSGGVLGIAGRWGGSGGGYTLAIPSYTSGATGDFNIGAGSFANAILSEGADPSASYSANMVTGTGKITILSMNSSKVKGTFQFTGRNTGGASKSVTDGEFEIEF